MYDMATFENPMLAKGKERAVYDYSITSHPVLPTRNLNRLRVPCLFIYHFSVTRK